MHLECREGRNSSADVIPGEHDLEQWTVSKAANRPERSRPPVRRGCPDAAAPPALALHRSSSAATLGEAERSMRNASVLAKKPIRFSNFDLSAVGHRRADHHILLAGHRASSAAQAATVS